MAAGRGTFRMKAMTSMLGMALVMTMVATTDAQLRPRVDPKRSVRGYQPPIAPPLVSTFCGRRKECAREGRCTQVGEDCVATSMEVCAFSEGCRDDGRCFLDPEAQRCDDGRRRASPGAIPTGATIIGLGGVGFIAGILLCVSATNSMLAGRSGGNLDAGIGLTVGGAVAAAAVGLPILLVGRKKEWRPGLVAWELSVGATGGSLQLQF
jgi:hypothetical protein